MLVARAWSRRPRQTGILLPPAWMCVGGRGGPGDPLAPAHELSLCAPCPAHRPCFRRMRTVRKPLLHPLTRLALWSTTAQSRNRAHSPPRDCRPSPPKPPLSVPLPPDACACVRSPRVWPQHEPGEAAARPDRRGCAHAERQDCEGAAEAGEGVSGCLQGPHVSGTAPSARTRKPSLSQLVSVWPLPSAVRLTLCLFA